MELLKASGYFPWRFERSGRWNIYPIIQEELEVCSANLCSVFSFFWLGAFVRCAFGIWLVSFLLATSGKRRGEERRGEEERREYLILVNNHCQFHLGKCVWHFDCHWSRALSIDGKRDGERSQRTSSAAPASISGISVQCL
jgi:hypothetical protein